MQGQRDLKAVSRLIMSELTPTVQGQHGAFFMADPQEGEAEERPLRLLASYGYKRRKRLSNQFKPGEGLVGQAALEKKSILITEAPDDYIKVTSGLGESSPVNIIVLPVLFEDQVLGVIELGSFHRFSEVSLDFLEQLMETIGVVLNTLIANMRTEELLEQSQSLTQELQSQSEELQARQDELKRSNAELEEQAQSLKSSEELLQAQQEELQQTNEELQQKAELLETQNRDIEIKNREIELARAGLEEKAEQLALSSKYKSEFLANMSHELRTPLNSLLILSKLLSDNEEGNLNDKQLEFADTINTASRDLLALINDIRYLNPELERAESVVAFSVTDTGVGIAQDKLRVIFEAFQQADGTTSRRYGGTGLGLSISRELARLLGGELRVHSAEGEGATFTLYLPSTLQATEPTPSPGVPAEVRPESIEAILGGNGGGTSTPQTAQAADAEGR